MQHNQKCQNHESGVSEVIGAVLLIALVVTAVAIVGVGLLSQPLPKQIPALESVISTSGSIVQITHNGGDTLQKGDFVVLVDGVDKTSLFNKDGALTWQSWSPGESLTVPYTNPNSVRIVYTGAGASATLSSANFGEFGVPTSVPTTTIPPTPTPTITHTITASAGANGAVTPAGVTTVNDGATPTYAITPNPGYNVVDVLVNGISVGAVTSYIFPSVTSDQTISATFAINMYTITASSGANGAVTPAGVTPVSYGATPTYAITPNPGYHVVDVLVNGTSVGAVTSYIFPSVTTDKTISATFAQNPRGQMFYEDFNAAFTGWTISGASRQTGTVPKNGTASVRMRSNNQYMYKTFSTAGDMDIVVQFAWATTLTASGEYARAEYSTDGGTSWITLSQINGPVTQNTLSIVTSPVLPAAADNNSNFQLRFIIMGSNNSDLLYVDDVKVTGIPI
jgi:flagellin-like protein